MYHGSFGATYVRLFVERLRGVAVGIVVGFGDMFDEKSLKEGGLYCLTWTRLVISSTFVS